MATTLKRQPPPPPPATDDPVMRDWLWRLNRWFLDLTQFISPGGGIDPGVITGAVLNGSGAPAPGSGADGNLYINNSGSNKVIPAGLLAEGAAVTDVTGNQLYERVSGAWRPIV